MDQFLWPEKYRPGTVQECILPDRIKNIFQVYVDQKEIPNLLLYGRSGVGKTTIAKALCNQVGCDYIVINGSDETGIETFRIKIKTYASSVSLYNTGKRKVVIIDEADYMNPNSLQPALRNAIEEFSINCVFIFTCNQKEKIIPAIHSRCATVDFGLKRDERESIAKQFMERVEFILNSENVIFDRKVLAEFIKKYFPDFRKTLNELQKWSKHGPIDTGILAQVTDVKIGELMKVLKNKNFTEVRKWVALNSDIDQQQLFRKVYDNLYNYLKPQSIPTAVVILADYSYKAAFVADGEINATACFCHLMSDCEMM